MKNIYSKIILFFLLCTGLTVKAQLKFTASISPAQVYKDGLVQLNLTVENARDLQQILPPQINDFIIVSGPNQESGMSTVNGDVKSYQSVVFILQPKKPGIFTIPAGTAIADGVTLRSNPVVVKVSNTAGGNNAPSYVPVSPYNLLNPFASTEPDLVYNDNILKRSENAEDKIKKNVFVKATANKTTCFVGEPIIATYKLFTRLKSESSMTKNPSFNGFSVIDLQQPDNLNYAREKLNGREYNVYTIRKVQLYPLQPGNLILETAVIDNLVQFIKADYANKSAGLPGEFFSDFAADIIPPEGLVSQKISLQTNPVTILVKPLPAVNKPLSYKGAVGKFALEASLEKNNFSTDDIGKLTVSISGEGNLQLVTVPEIKWPEGIDGFDPAINDDLIKTTVPVSGKKRIVYPFSVTTAGTYMIPPVSFSFFNPATEKYQTIETKPINYTVTKGTGKTTRLHSDAKAKNESLLNKFFSSRLRVVSVVAILIICGLLFWLKMDKRKEKKKQDEIAETADKVMEENVNEIVAQENQHPLKAAEDCLENNSTDSFYALLNQGLKNYLSQKLGIPPEELNKKTIGEQLDKKEVNNLISLELQALIDEIEWQLYTPLNDNDKMQDMLNRTNELLQVINQYKT